MNLLGETLRHHRQVGRHMSNGKLIPAKARDDVGISQAAQQPTAGCLKQAVTDRMPQRVVDLLEPVEINIEQRQSGAAMGHAGDHLVQSDAEQNTIGQCRQRIVVRGEADMFLGASLLGHVLVGRDPTSVGDGSLRYGDRSSRFTGHNECSALLGICETPLLQIGVLQQVVGKLMGNLHFGEYVVRRQPRGKRSRINREQLQEPMISTRSVSGCGRSSADPATCCSTQRRTAHSGYAARGRVPAGRHFAAALPPPPAGHARSPPRA